MNTSRNCAISIVHNGSVFLFKVGAMQNAILLNGRNTCEKIVISKNGMLMVHVHKLESCDEKEGSVFRNVLLVRWI